MSHHIVELTDPPAAAAIAAAASPLLSAAALIAGTLALSISPFLPLCLSFVRLLFFLSPSLPHSIT